MKLRTKPHVHRHVCSIASHVSSSCTALRRSSTWSRLTDELKSRPFNITYDDLSFTPSYLLSITLRDFLPKACHPDYYNLGLQNIPLQFSSIDRPHALPQGHHLVYFPPPIPQKDLLPDGTDTLHSPQNPTLFKRRLWAGGSVTFNTSSASRLYLSGTRAACIEGVRGVTVKGKEGEEKIFVHIERRYGNMSLDTYDRGKTTGAHEIEEGLIKSIWEGDGAAIVEKRDLVFLRAKESSKVDDGVHERVVKPTQTPSFGISLTPTPSFLFRFSALTFNAHRIHLDAHYSREVEGHRNVLVHGPLSLVLMLAALHSQLREGQMVTSLTYRNLAPLYAEEEMRVCLRMERGEGEKWQVWVEGRDGGYAVKGSATVGLLE